MILKVNKDCHLNELHKLMKELKKKGFILNLNEEKKYFLLDLKGDFTLIDENWLKSFTYINQSICLSVLYEKTNRLYHPEDSIVEIRGIKIGGNEKVVVIGGSYLLESEDIICNNAQKVKEAGGSMLIGGTYAQSSFPYNNPNIDTLGLLSMVKAREKTGLPIVSELISINKINEWSQHVDLIQIGSRNMQNFPMLKALGKIKTPVLLKRGLANTIEEWIMAAEYIMAEGNHNVILCDCGIRTFEPYTENTLDLSAIPIIKERTHLPIIIDSSNSTGYWKYVEPISLAAIAAGADGLIIEVHPNPEKEINRIQALRPKEFASLIKKSQEIAKVIGRKELTMA